MQIQTNELEGRTAVNNNKGSIPIVLRYPLEDILDLLREEKDAIARHNLSQLCIQTLDYCSNNGYSTSEYRRRLTQLLS